MRPSSHRTSYLSDEVRNNPGTPAPRLGGVHLVNRTDTLILFLRSSSFRQATEKNLASGRTRSRQPIHAHNYLAQIDRPLYFMNTVLSTKRQWSKWSLLPILLFISDLHGFHSTSSTQRRHLPTTHVRSKEKHSHPSTKDDIIASSESEAPQKIMPARYLATMALLPKQGTSFVLDRLEADPALELLSTRDKAFARLLVATTERRIGQIDKILDICQNEKPDKKKRSKIDQHIKMVLRVGAAQLLFLQTPEHAAIKETVDLLRMNRNARVPESKIKYANAVLRRLTREGTQLIAMTDILDNASSWLVQQWNHDWGESVTRQIVEAAMTESPRCISVRRRGASDLQQVETLAGLFPQAEILPQGSIRIVEAPVGPVSDWPLYEAGDYWFQDLAATIPALALQKLLNQIDHAANSFRVVDMCAAPGGKTAQLCDVGFQVTAVERSPRRARRLTENLNRLGMNCELIVADGTEWVPLQPMDAVLLDVPCSATGTGSKRPDVLRKVHDDTFTELLESQRSLAIHVLDKVLREDGILVYATCSLLKMESEDQVRKLLDRGGCEVVPFPIDGDFAFLASSVDHDGFLRMIPGQRNDLGAYDGFFVALLRKTSR